MKNQYNLEQNYGPEHLIVFVRFEQKSAYQIYRAHRLQYSWKKSVDIIIRNICQPQPKALKLNLHSTVSCLCSNCHLVTNNCSLSHMNQHSYGPTLQQIWYMHRAAVKFNTTSIIIFFLILSRSSLQAFQVSRSVKKLN